MAGVPAHAGFPHFTDAIKREGVAVSLIQHIRDWQREQRIKRLANELENYTDIIACAHQEKARLWDALARECQQRSQVQIARMESARGLRG